MNESLSEEWLSAIFCLLCDQVGCASVSAAAGSMNMSSSVNPASLALIYQAGRLPRPVQVSGPSGFWNLGAPTFLITGLA